MRMDSMVMSSLFTERFVTTIPELPASGRRLRHTLTSEGPVSTLIPLRAIVDADDGIEDASEATVAPETDLPPFALGAPDSNRTLLSGLDGTDASDGATSDTLP